MRRKFTDTLLAWQKEENKPCLLVKGARQVGKTYVIDKFAKANYRNYIYINFELMPEYKKIFSGNLDIDTLKMNLEVNFPGKLQGVGQEEGKNNTIVFLDEIQACPQARVALKTFALDGTMDVVASGSLLGLYYKEVSSYPAGYERAVELFPMDFEEFLWAMGMGEGVIETVREGFWRNVPRRRGRGVEGAMGGGATTDETERTQVMPGDGLKMTREAGQMQVAFGDGLGMAREAGQVRVASGNGLEMMREAGRVRVAPVSGSVLGKMEEYFRMYLLVGGMPNVVKTYVEKRSLTEVRVRQREIIESYKNDVLKYAETTDKQKILRTFESIPMQLAKKNKKFMYNDIDAADDNASERKYGSAISWLRDAGIVNFCYNLTEPALPLNVNRKLDSYKIYMRDTGLLVAMLDAGVQKAVVERDLYINEGALVENVCAEEITTRYEGATYFERKGKLEIDFILDVEGEVVALEVKSGRNRQAKSLRSMMENYRGVGRYVMLEDGEEIYRDEAGVEHYPLFAVMFI